MSNGSVTEEDRAWAQRVYEWLLFAGTEDRDTNAKEVDYLAREAARIREEERERLLTAMQEMIDAAPQTVVAIGLRAFVSLIRTPSPSAALSTLPNTDERMG